MSIIKILPFVLSRYVTLEALLATKAGYLEMLLNDARIFLRNLPAAEMSREGLDGLKEHVEDLLTHARPAQELADKVSHLETAAHSVRLFLDFLPTDLGLGGLNGAKARLQQQFEAALEQAPCCG